MQKLPIFSAYGVELEYMIVNRDDLSVFPISDKLIFDVAGQFKNEVTFENIAWSNELVLHVIELKTNGPAGTLEPLPDYFQKEVIKINNLLEKYNAKLLPTGAHPLMDPFTEAKLWPHDDNIIYDTYHRIFDCRGHGWSNLQSVHLNLPFANDEEFAKLHTAIRLILPILPSLCASTPIIDGRITGVLDTRLEYYRLNQQKIPSVTGEVIPEQVFSEKEYNEKILMKMYQQISSHDPDKILQEEWLNSRGAIARFDRNTIEIRIIDTQECPECDLAIISLVVGILKALVNEKWQSFEKQSHWNEVQLKNIFLANVAYGMKTKIAESDYLNVFGLDKPNATARELWQHLLIEISKDEMLTVAHVKTLQTIIEHGNLAERILAALHGKITKEKINGLYHQLSYCLDKGVIFLPS